jgi:GT2 family glycosyltransferase/glycosyltransferase involved in cell wall biosynthesis
MVSIIILNKDKLEFLRPCVESVLQLTTYKDYEILIVDNNSILDETFLYYKELDKQKNIRILEYNNPEFNYQKIVNYAVRESNGDYIVQLNNDTKLLTPNWLELMIEVAKHDDVGAVGAVLYYPDLRVQHVGGILLESEPYALHKYAGLPKNTWYVMMEQRAAHKVIWVTGACTMSRRDVYEQVGYMNEEYQTFYGDVDFCLKMRAIGLSIMMQPGVELIHYEGITRGNHMEAKQQKIYDADCKLFITNWSAELKKNDFYNTISNEDDSEFIYKRADVCRKILIYNPSLYILGGGEKYMGHLCEFLESYYPDAEIDILINDLLYDVLEIENITLLERLTSRFNLQLNHTNVRKVDIEKAKTFDDIPENNPIIANITAEYDIFINFMFLSKQQGRARKNIYICMFPPKPNCEMAKINNELFVNSYDMFIPISEFSCEWFVKYWGENQNHEIIYPPVFSKQNISSLYDETKKENIILSVGRFFTAGHNKKQLEMVKSFIENKEKMRNYELHLVGGLSDNLPDIQYVETIKSLIEDFPIFIHIDIKTEAVASLFEKAKIFWHWAGCGENIDEEPCKAEHFGITTVEAMSYGVVPVVINKGGQPEIVDDSINGYLWNDVNECIEKTCILIDDKNLRVALAKQAVKKSMNFTVEAFNRRCETVFKSIKSKATAGKKDEISDNQQMIYKRNIIKRIIIKTAKTGYKMFRGLYRLLPLPKSTKSKIKSIVGRIAIKLQNTSGIVDPIVVAQYNEYEKIIREKDAVIAEQQINIEQNKLCINSVFRYCKLINEKER